MNAKGSIAVIPRPVLSQDETDSEAFASRARSGNDLEIRGGISSYQGIRDGGYTEVSQAAQRLTGKPPCSLEAFLRSPPFTSASEQRAGA